MTRPLDDIDLAGWAYVVTEYADLLSVVGAGAPGHEHVASRQQAVALAWAGIRDLPLVVDDAVQDARKFRDEHEELTRAYLARFDQEMR